MLATHNDFSRGIESVPILMDEGDASHSVDDFEKTYTYVRTISIHASARLSVDNLPSSTVGRTLSCHESRDTCTDMDSACSCQLPEDARDYVNQGLLHPHHIVKVCIFLFLEYVLYVIGVLALFYFARH